MIEGENRRPVIYPALALLFLAPAIAELLAGAAPPAEFFHPIGFILLVILYGGGAILARELMHRWNKGWVSLLVLGAAYGIAEEALACKSFFDPHWKDLGSLAEFGRWGGVNWVWSLGLTIYHAVFSICIPVLLVYLIFPETRNKKWLHGRHFFKLSVLWILDGIFLFIFISQYRPPLFHLLVAAVVVAGLIKAARHISYTPVTINAVAGSAATGPHKPCWLIRTWLTGFLFTLCFFVLIMGGPNISENPLHIMAALVILVLLAAGVSLSGGARAVLWSEKHQLALVSGALGFLILLAPIQEFDSRRPDNTTGMTLVCIAFLIFLLWLARRVKNRRMHDQKG